MTLLQAIITGVIAVVGLASLILKWWYGAGKLEKEYYETMAKLKAKQDERQIAMQNNDWRNFHLLTDDCSKLSETADGLRQRLKSRGIVLARP